MALSSGVAAFFFFFFFLSGGMEYNAQDPSSCLPLFIRGAVISDLHVLEIGGMERRECGSFFLFPMPNFFAHPNMPLFPESFVSSLNDVSLPASDVKSLILGSTRCLLRLTYVYIDLADFPRFESRGERIEGHSSKPVWSDSFSLGQTLLHTCARGAMCTDCTFIRRGLKCRIPLHRKGRRLRARRHFSNECIAEICARIFRPHQEFCPEAQISILEGTRVPNHPGPKRGSFGGGGEGYKRHIPLPLDAVWT